MSTSTYQSPIARPQPYIKKITSLSAEALAVDQGTDKAKQDTALFAEKHTEDFAGTVLGLRDILIAFEAKLGALLEQTCDAAAYLSSRYIIFDQVFLARVLKIRSDAEVQDVILELRASLKTPNLTTKYELDGAPGVRKALVELEGLIMYESERILAELQRNTSWVAAVRNLTPSLNGMREGIPKIVKALEGYASG